MKTPDKKQKQKKKEKLDAVRTRGGRCDFLYIFTKNYAETLIYKGIERWKKIKIKLNKDNLNAIIQILDKYENAHLGQNSDFKAVLSIYEDLHIKLMKKTITERKNDQNFKISLKYYQAFALESILRTFLNSANSQNNDIYFFNALLNIANQIHQVL